MKIYLRLLLLFLFLVSHSFAQSPAWQWVKDVEGPSFEYGYSIAVDASNNVYTTGSFTGTVDFDPGPGVFNLSGGDGFILKTDESGNFIWAMATGGAGYSIVVDGSGNLVILGSFSGTKDFDPGTAVFNLTSNGSTDIFVSKLDSSGNFIWADMMGGLQADQGNSIAADASGNIYAYGKFYGLVDFDPGAGTFSLTSVGLTEGFLVKLDGLGNLIWAKQTGGMNAAGCSSVFIDLNGNIHYTGIFSGTADLDPGPTTFMKTSLSNSSDVFVTKLDSSGNFVYAKSVGGIGSDVGNSIAVDDSENVYVTGLFQVTADFDPGSGGHNLTATGYGDIFLLKLDNLGNFVWAQRFGGALAYNTGFEISFDPTGFSNLYLTGKFGGTSDFDPGVNITNLASAGGEDIFISKMTSAGGFVWAKAAGGNNNDYSVAMDFDSNNNIYLTGTFLSSLVSFDSTLIPVTGTASQNIFIGKLNSSLGTSDQLENNSTEYISLFPNPAMDQVTITLPNKFKIVELTLSDMAGKNIFTFVTDESEQVEMNLATYPPGMYFLRVQSAGFTEVKKLVIASDQ